MGKYVGAPYNFIPFTNNIFRYEEGKQTSHDDVSDELLSGKITYTITAETPIIVDDGTGHFCKNKDGKYAIPGSSIRGLIRNNVQILGLSSVKEDIDSYALMYRNVASGPKKERKRYAEVLGVDNNDVETRGIARNVKAGYLTLKAGKYYITCGDLDDSYTFEKRVKTGTESYKKSGFFNACKRLFGVSSGWGTRDTFEDVEYVKVADLIRDKITESMEMFHAEIEKSIKDTEAQVSAIKKQTHKRLDKVDKRIADLMKLLAEKLSNEQKLRDEVSANAKNFEWITDFVARVEAILEVE